MDITERDFLLSIYKTQSFPFWYYRDKYAVQLLTYFLKEPTKISVLKASFYHKFLQKKPLKTITSQLANNQLRASDLLQYLPSEWLNFSLSFTHWGQISKYHNLNWTQTTRPGFSFVLQLNFDDRHHAQYYKWIQPINGEDPLFKYRCHPVSEKKHELTMAWARLDIDLTTGEVLIEEIQSDWFKEFDHIFESQLARKVACEHQPISEGWIHRQAITSIHNLKQYKAYLAPYRKIWAEAMLSATIDFCVQELGIRDLYMHTYASGCQLKNCRPPKSLYTKLPKRFAFKLTGHAPKFISSAKKIQKKIRKGTFNWWRLAF